jgi:hypothetical protein
MEPTTEVFLVFLGRKTGAQGAFSEYVLPWVAGPSPNDVRAVYAEYEHIHSPRLQYGSEDGSLSRVPYDQFFNIEVDLCRTK